jgi:hypothetical protein
MRHNGGAAKVSRVLTMGCQSELVPNPQAETAPLRQGFNLHRSDHFVKRWGRQSHEKDTAVDPGASAGVGPTGLMIPSLHKVVTGTSRASADLARCAQPLGKLRCESRSYHATSSDKCGLWMVGDSQSQSSHMYAGECTTGTRRRE